MWRGRVWFLASQRVIYAGCFLFPSGYLQYPTKSNYRKGWSNELYRPEMAGNLLTIIMFIALFRNENFLHRCLVCWKNNIQGVMEWHQFRTTLPAIRRGKKM